MTVNPTFVLAYCTDNKEVVREIDHALHQTGIATQHLSCDQFEQQDTFYTQIQRNNLPTILLLSDNFFKAEHCMKESIRLLQDDSTKSRLTFVILDRKFKKSGAVNYSYEPTEFTRISNVIHYMNHWQDQYLDLRKQAKEMSDEERSGLDEQLQKIKSISSEIGEFLRLLRDTDYVHYKTLKSNDYKGLFHRIGYPNHHQKYLEALENTTKPTASITPQTAQIPTIEPSPSINIIEEIINDNAEELLNENPSLVEDSNNIAPPTESETPQTNQNSKPFFERIVSQFDDVPPSSPEVSEIAPKEDYPAAKEEGIETNQSIAANEIFNKVTDNLDLVNGHDETSATLIQDNDNIHTEVLPSSINTDKTIINDAELNALANGELLPKIDLPIEIKNEEVEKINEDANELEHSIFAEEQEIQNETEESIEQEQKIEQKIEQEAETEESIEQEIHVSSDTISIESTSMDGQGFLMESVRNDLRQAKQYIDAGEVQNGVQIYQNLLHEYPQNTEIRLLYAATLAKRLHHHGKASTELEKILEIDNQDADAYHLLAEIAEMHKDYILAKSYYEKVLTIDPHYPNVAYRIGGILAKHFTTHKKLAAKYFKDAIALNKRHVDAHYQYATLLNEHFGKYSKAIKHFKKTLKLNPLHPFAAYDLALLYHKLYEPNIAADYYQKAIKNNPELKTQQNDAVFLELESHNLAQLTPLEAFERGLAFEGSNAYHQSVETTPTRPQVDKVVLITGATSGIGKATATLFAEQGYRLILTGRRSDRLEAIQTQFETEYDSDILVLPFDVRDVQTVQQVVDSLGEEWKNIDILINNAGLAKGLTPIHKGNLAHWETMIDTNIKGLLYLTRAIAPQMVKRGSGHIINLCSTAGKEVYPNGNVYCATKFAVDALTKAMRLDLYKHNIKVSQVSPAHVEQTEFALVRFDGDKNRAKIYDDFNPLTAQDVAATIYYIASQPAHVNIRDIVLSGNQQASSTNLHRSGRIFDEEE